MILMKRKKRPGLKFNPGLALIGLRTTGPRGLNNDSSGHTTQLTVNPLFKCKTSLIMNCLRRVEGKTKRTGCNLEREFDLW